MIIRLKKADFSTNNIGSLDTWPIYIQMDAGVKYSGPNFVKKNGAYTGIFTVIPGYEIDVDQIEATMDGDALSSEITATKDKVTISISAVTKTLYIHIPTVSVEIEEDEEGDTPASTVWYIDHRNNISRFTSAVNTAGLGWCHVPSTDTYKAYVGKPINAIGFFTDFASQTVTIMKVPEKGDVTSGTIIATKTATGSGTKEFVYVTFPTVTLADGECLAAFTQDDTNINFYYASGSAVTDANGVVDSNFYGRVPKVYGSGTAWTSYNASICLGWSIGYVVQ